MLLSEMFGVKRMVPFKAKGYNGKEFRISVYEDGVENIQFRVGEGDWDPCQRWAVYDIIAAAPSGIIHLPPPLTDEQREQLKAIWTLGGRWIGKGDLRYGVYAFTERPIKSAGAWCSGGSSYNVLHSNSVCDLVSWSDPEPYDIGKALGVGKC